MSTVLKVTRPHPGLQGPALSWGCEFSSDSKLPLELPRCLVVTHHGRCRARSVTAVGARVRLLSVYPPAVLPRVMGLPPWAFLGPGSPGMRASVCISICRKALPGLVGSFPFPGARACAVLY